MLWFAHRKSFPEVQNVTQRLIDAIKLAKGAPLPFDKATLCVTLDVIGRVGFAKDFGSTSEFRAAIENPQPPPQGPPPNTMHSRLPRCMRGIILCITLTRGALQAKGSFSLA